MSRKDWFCPSYALPEPALAALEAWVAGVNWPAGTELKDPAKFHITAFYSRSGYANQEHHDWLAEQGPALFPVRATAVRAFDPGDGHAMIPVVLTFEGAELYAHAAQLTDAAEHRGLEPIRHPDGYHAHITVAFVPSLPEGLEPPAVEFSTTHLYEQHTLSDQLKAERAA